MGGITCPGQDRQADRQADASQCPPDIGVNELGGALANEMRANNLSSGHIRHLPGGHVEFCFRLKDGSRYPQTWSAGDVAATWMREHRVLSRREFFGRYPLARRSASLHDRALKILGRRGLIVKDHGLWIWIDG
jgi:hypothetical protein